MGEGIIRQALYRYVPIKARDFSQDWHENAIRSAYASDDDTWNLTAVFCMRFVRRFDGQIVEELHNKDTAIELEAVLAAGNWGVKAAWPQVAALVHSGQTPKPLLLAAIEAVPSIRPQEAREVLSNLTESDDDEDIVETVHEALAAAEKTYLEEEDDGDKLLL